MPASFILDEAIWKKAKEAVDRDKYDEDSYWAVVVTVYKNMGGKIKEKAESQTDNSKQGVDMDKDTELELMKAEVQELRKIVLNKQKVILQRADYNEQDRIRTKDGRVGTIKIAIDYETYAVKFDDEPDRTRIVKESEIAEKISMSKTKAQGSGNKKVILQALKKEIQELRKLVLGKVKLQDDNPTFKEEYKGYTIYIEQRPGLGTFYYKIFDASGNKVADGSEQELYYPQFADARFDARELIEYGKF